MEIARHWRLQQQRYQLIGSICSECKEPSFPPREICPHCDGASGTQYASKSEALPYSHTLAAAQTTERLEQREVEVEINENRGMIFQAASVTT